MSALRDFLRGGTEEKVISGEDRLYDGASIMDGDDGLCLCPFLEKVVVDNEREIRIMTGELLIFSSRIDMKRYLLSHKVYHHIRADRRYRPPLQRYCSAAFHLCSSVAF